MEQTTALRQLAHSRRDTNPLIVQASNIGVTAFQRRSNLRANRRLSRISINPIATPIWEQQILKPSEDLQKRFVPQTKPQQYLAESIAIETEPLPAVSETNLDAAPIANPIANDIQNLQSTSANTTILSEEEVAELDRLDPISEPAKEVAQLLPAEKDNIVVENTPSSPQSKPTATAPSQKLEKSLQQLEQSLTTIQGETIMDFGDSLQKITDLRDAVLQQEQKLSSQHSSNVSQVEKEADAKAKQAMLSNLEHALQNTQTELSHLEQQPDADKNLITQIRQQLQEQKRKFDQLLREQKDVTMHTQTTPQVATTQGAMPQQATKSTPITTPKITDAPNAINGIVTDQNGKLLQGVVVIIKSSEGQPLRALKTNPLGQFSITTPLENGTYLVETESGNLAFDTVTVELKGSAISPIIIAAH